jgi:hypothetical protein
MNSQTKLGARVEDREGPQEWEHRQQQFFPAIIAPTTRIHSLRVMTRTGSTPHGGQTMTKALAVRSESAEVNSMPELRSEDEDKILSNLQGNLEALDVLFSRYRRTLLLVAYRVLGDHNQAEAEDAVQRCLQSASDNVPQFGNEGAFRSWLVRVLIDEALLILQEREWGACALRPD